MRVRDFTPPPASRASSARCVHAAGEFRPRAAPLTMRWRSIRLLPRKAPDTISEEEMGLADAFGRGARSRHDMGMFGVLLCESSRSSSVERCEGGFDLGGDLTSRADRGQSLAAPQPIRRLDHVRLSCGRPRVRPAIYAWASACGHPKDNHNGLTMNLNSRLFDSIRVKPAASKPEVRHGTNRNAIIPVARNRARSAPRWGGCARGQFFQFCLEHVREYNATYNYFNGMSADDVAELSARRADRPSADLVDGHQSRRRTRGFREDGDEAGPAADPLGMHRTRRPFADAPRKPRHGIAVLKSLGDLGLDETADAAAVKARYKDLVKRLHPDANGGDRSNEDRLREIIRAYNHLKSVKLG